MFRFLKSAFLTAFLAVSLQAESVTCSDGRVIGLTPFNQHTAKAVLCGEKSVVVEDKVAAPEGFEKIFGPRPQAKDFSNYRVFQQARDLWEQDRAGFRGGGLPEGADAESLKEASAVFKAWGLGECFVYQGRYGWKVRCPRAEWVPGIEFAFESVVISPHNLIASYQIQAASLGVKVPKDQRHPWVPEQVFGDK